jgi:hypothetical protein
MNKSDVSFTRQVGGVGVSSSGSILSIENKWGGTQNRADLIYAKMTSFRGGPLGDFLQCDYDSTTKAKIDKDGNFVGAGYINAASGYRVNGTEVLDGSFFLKNIAKWLGDCTYNDAQFDIKADTSEGADNKFVAVCGGGAASDDRGANVMLHGNEAATTGSKGQVIISAGNVYSGGDDGTILMKTAGAEAVRIDRGKQLVGKAGAAFAGGLAAGSESVPNVSVLRPPRGTQPPTSGNLLEGDLFFDTDDRALKIYNASTEQWATVFAF